MESLEALQARRYARWRQTPASHIRDATEAAALIDRVGLATLYPVSTEIPNLYHAYVGDPAASTDSKWDSPSGHVYAWRWELGRPETAFYTALVRKRPTWVAWALLPAVLCLCGDLRALDELVDMRVISRDAYRVAQALETSGGALSTGELRAAAGFPTGKEQRAAYLKAVEELDTRMLLAKVFARDGDEMSHALVSARYPQQVAAAERMSRAEALDALFAAYLPNAIYTVPSALAKDLKVPEAELRAGLDRVVAQGHAAATELAGHKGACYVWREG
ncbi:MAG TPA: hypothetical protein VGS80_07600 [Ktedonobacterales bacterium]|nr:hypothetical protein [Ktedonobacterales bacterium]